MLKLKQFNLGPLETNCYLIYNDKQALAVDPGGDPEAVIDFLQTQELNLQTILNTHLHFDHIQGNQSLSSRTGAEIMAPQKDSFLLQTEVGGGGFMGFPETPAFDFINLEPGQTVFLDSPCHVLGTPGHTPGSLSFYFPELNAVFVGDLLFFRSVGRTDFPGGDPEVLKESAQKQIFTLPDNTTIYSGHGPESRVLDERLHNPFFHEHKFI
ncbi:MBL fold metallo-hydrolase [Desulfonatronovibrio hydrogenovorans]|uniref:MBL fold metallo-hydrolase n=1 Tax=Desulfonatronovibrio hydrogenovorans TaxID=53245 RepID=UPI00048B1093|nr:MBL fold metallo-hydrolase [Desulfonatronovibrio hydrogenovorans]